MYVIIHPLKKPATQAFFLIQQRHVEFYVGKKIRRLFLAKYKTKEKTTFHFCKTNNTLQYTLKVTLERYSTCTNV